MFAAASNHYSGPDQYSFAGEIDAHNVTEKEIVANGTVEERRQRHLHPFELPGSEVSAPEDQPLRGDVLVG